MAITLDDDFPEITPPDWEEEKKSPQKSDSDSIVEAARLKWAAEAQAELKQLDKKPKKEPKPLKPEPAPEEDEQIIIAEAEIEKKRRIGKKWLQNQHKTAKKIANQELVGTMKFFAEVYKDKTQPVKIRMEAAKELKAEAVGRVAAREAIPAPTRSTVPPLNFDLGSIDELKNANKPTEEDNGGAENEPSGSDLE